MAVTGDTGVPQFISNHCFVATPPLCRSTIRTKARAPSDMLPVTCKWCYCLSFLGPSMVSVVFRVVRSWWFCNGGFWLRVCSSHISGWLHRLRCSLQFHLECLALCRVGSGETLWPVGTLGRRQVVSSRPSDTGGHRVTRARLVFWRSGASGIGVSAVDRTSTFWGVFTVSARPCWPPLRT